MRASKLDILRASIRQVVGMLADKKVPVYQRGLKAACVYNKAGNVEYVILPQLPDGASDDLICAVHGFLDHECAHILFTDYHWLNAGKKSGVKRLHNIIEDTMIERRMRKAYKGVGKNLDNVWGFVRDELLTPGIEAAIASGVETAIWQEALVTAIHAWAGQQGAQDYMLKYDLNDKMKGWVEMVGQDLIDKIPLVKNTEDGYRLSVAIQNRMDTWAEKAAEEDEKRRREAERKEMESLAPPPEHSSTEEEEDFEDDDGDDFMPPPDEDEDGDFADDDGDDSGREDFSPDDDDAPPEREGEEDADEDDDSYESDETEDSDEGDEGDYNPDEDEDDSDDSEDDDEGEDDSDEDDDDHSDGDSDGDGDGEETMDDDELERARRLRESLDGARDLDDMFSDAVKDTISSDYHRNQYWVASKDLDTVEQWKVTDAYKSLAQGCLDNVEKEVKGTVGTLAKRLERLIVAQSHDRQVPGYRSGKIHSASLHRLIAGGDDRIFRRKYKNNTKEVAVSLVIDCSGSMSYGAGSKSRIALAIESAFAMTKALSRLNITVEVSGFTTRVETYYGRSSGSHYYPREATPKEKEVFRAIEATKHEMETTSVLRLARTENLYLPIFKGFDDRFDTERQAAMCSVPALMPLSQNVDGESIMEAAKRLTVRKEQRKIMFVLSDGQPAALGCHVTLNKDLIDSVQRIIQSGVEVLGVGIQTDCVKEYYPNYVTVSDVSSLPTTLIKSLENLLLANAR